MASRHSEDAPPAGSRGAPSGSRGPLIHVSTRCESIEEFVAKFADFASEGSLVLPASGELPVGTEGRFAIRLKDQSVAMRGRCRVLDVRSTQPAAAGGPRRAFLRVALVEMEEGSTSVHRRLLAHRRAAVPLPIVARPSEPTLVNPPRPEVPAPPPLRTPPPPPVSALAATLIGVGSRPRATTSPIGVPRLPPNPLAAYVSAPARAPSASFTLPANPLSDMNAADLASFIESTLFEADDEDATAERPGKSISDDDATLERAAPASPVEPEVEPTAPTTIDPAPAPHPVSARAAARPAASKPAPAIRGLVARLAPYAAVAVAAFWLGHLIRRPTPRPAPAASTAPAASLAPAPAASLAPAASSAPAPAAPGAPAASSAPAPAAPGAPAAFPAPAPAAASAPAPAAPSPTPAAIEPSKPAAEAAPPAEAVAAREGCTARVVTEPPDAKVVWRGKLLGRSPLGETSIACGAGTLLISHERYQTVTRELAATAGTPVMISERLHRPPATLIVGSSPAGAAITVNGQALGAAPRHLSTWRYEQVSIRASLAGYAPWTKKVYLSGATTTVTAQLAPAGRGR